MPVIASTSSVQDPVRIFRKNEEGMKLDISIKGPGETFGEMALLTGEPRSADAETLEETHLMVLSKDKFDRIMRDFPDVSKVFAREMRRWLFTDEKRLEIHARERTEILADDLV